MSRFLSGFAGEPFFFFPGSPGIPFSVSAVPPHRASSIHRIPLCFRFLPVVTARYFAKFFGFSPLVASPKK
jgi:hypothetical protein